jgi:hypothetical protein
MVECPHFVNKYLGGDDLVMRIISLTDSELDHLR